MYEIYELQFEKKVKNNPDMAPIKHAWDELGRRVASGRPPRTVATLQRALQREWTLVPQAFFSTLVNSMRTR